MVKELVAFKKGNRDKGGRGWLLYSINFKGKCAWENKKNMNRN
jgi:hypothetical protein